MHSVSLVHCFLIYYISWFLILSLQAYDQHLNMILGDVEETVTTIEIDEETYEEIYKVSHEILLIAFKMSIVFNIQQLNTYLWKPVMI